MDHLIKPIKLKFCRAERQTADFCKMVTDWCANNPINLRCELREKRLGFRLIIEEFSEPAPLENFGFHFGELIHNLRSLLDNLVYASARGVSDPPENPSVIYFPIIKRKNLFDNQKVKRCMNQLGPQATELITKLQPFQRNSPEVAGTPEKDPLVLLQWLNNSDKHRIPTVTIVSPNEIAPHHTVKFYSEQDADNNVPPNIRIHVGKYKPGTVVLEQITNCPIESVSGRLECKATLAIETPNGVFPVNELSVSLLNYTRLVVAEFFKLFASDNKI